MPVRYDVWLTLIASVVLSATAQLFLKLGSRHLASEGGPIELARSAALSPPIWAGLALYGLSVALWIRVLSKLDLSMAYPFVGLGFLMTTGFGAIFLGENVTPMRILGTILVAGGCILVARSA